MPPTPPTGELRVVGDVPTAFGEVVAAEFAAVRQAGAGKAGDGRFRMALSGGDTARACYEHLATIATIDWAAVDLLLGDERCVPPDDAAANLDSCGKPSSCPPTVSPLFGRWTVTIPPPTRPSCPRSLRST